MSSIFPSIPSQIGALLHSVWIVWGAVWWIVLPIIGLIIAWESWKFHLHHRFLHSIRWKLLEIKVPKNNLKTPKGMEQIFAAAHTTYSYGFSFYEKYWKGFHEQFMAFELVGRAGETHFYLRVPDQMRNVMESAIYGQYPDAEITEVDDYLKQMPKILPNRDIDVAGFEEVFAKKSCYPIRTYESFEDSVEERRVDTMAPLIEAMSKMEGSEQFWLQIIIVPTGLEWTEEGVEEINKILKIEEPNKKKGGIFSSFMGLTAGEIVRALFEHPGEAKGEHDDQPRQQRFITSPRDKEVTEGIQRKISKFGFESTIRFLYNERRGESKDGDKNVFFGHSYIRQFNTQDMNNLRPDKETTSASYAVKGLFKKLRLRYRKRILWERYYNLSHQSHEVILNIEELATLYHFPINTVSSTELEKVESRKGSPPATLPIIDDTS